MTKRLASEMEMCPMEISEKKKSRFESYPEFEDMSKRVSDIEIKLNYLTNRVQALEDNYEKNRNVDNSLIFGVLDSYSKYKHDNNRFF